ncbi:MAG TPA: threonine-phosphate decarboxylase [Leptolyngbyaceae cyanobacterium M65_K2018_010]|nr:threonine-phosphate decarboxylase [Leptolyngbyaceae cyanobacterium M65_K2018_010]
MQGALAGLQHYPDPQYQALREALGNYHQLPTEWVLPGNGAAELLTWVGREISTQVGDLTPAAYVLTPAFADYGRALQSFGVQMQPWPILDSLAELAPLKTELPLCRDLPVAACLVNNPHNPTGHLWTAQVLLPLLDAFSLVVVDEAFMDFLPPAQAQSLIPWLADYPNLVVLRSLTKFYTLPGLRIGYALSHPDRLRRWQQWRDPWPVNGLAAAAAIAAVSDHEFQHRSWQWLPSTRQTLFDGLASTPGLHPLPGAANFLLVRSEQAVPPLQAQLIKQHKVVIRDCLSFAELGDRYLRVAVRTTAENERLLTALATLQAL